MQKVALIILGSLSINIFYCQTINKNYQIINFIDNDNIIDTLTYKINSDSIVGNIKTNILNLKFVQYIENNLYNYIEVPEKGWIAFVTSGNGMSRHEEIQIYNYDISRLNWILNKSISISNNINYGIEVPSLEFYYYEKEFETVNGKKTKYKINKPKSEDLQNLIKKAKKNKYNNYEIIEYIFNFSLNTNNLTQYNDLAFYLQNNHLSLYILDLIIKKFPKRVVAYLNIADSYFNLGNDIKAIVNYKKYIQLMTEQKKDLKKIPKYVYERIK